MKVLIADSDYHFTNTVANAWGLNDIELSTINEESILINSLKNEQFNCIFLSINFLSYSGLDFISFIKETQPLVETVLLCDPHNIEQADSALSKGAHSYLVKPISSRTIENTAKKLTVQKQAKEHSRNLEEHVLADLMGQTPEMRKILKLIYKIAPTNSTILITGESGTGKEFVANIIHRLSKRSNNEFMAINCGAIPENIVESELFGTRKGAFTGATIDKKGLFEEADNGSLFLDEIGDLPLQTQVKVLRFLQNKEIRRVGDTDNKYLDVRIIAATNKDLPNAIKNGTFREDLFYRLNIFHIHLPPLRERKETIPNLVKFFVLRYNQETGKNVINIDKAAQVALSTYHYPGNIRELENIIEHAVVLAEDDVITLEDLPEQFHKPLQLETPLTSDHLQLPGNASTEEETRENIESLAEIERKHIIKALTQFKNNQTEVSKKLGISRSTLWRKLQEHEIKIK